MTFLDFWKQSMGMNCVLCDMSSWRIFIIHSHSLVTERLFIINDVDYGDYEIIIESLHVRDLAFRAADVGSYANKSTNRISVGSFIPNLSFQIAPFVCGLTTWIIIINFCLRTFYVLKITPCHFCRYLYWKQQVVMAVVLLSVLLLLQLVSCQNE